MIDALNILLAQEDERNCCLFNEALQTMKLKTTLRWVKNDAQLMDFLANSSCKLPHFLFLDIDLPESGGMDCLVEIRGNNRLKDVAIAVFSRYNSEALMEDVLVNGANVYILKPKNVIQQKNVISQVINVFWQFHTSGLQKKNFLMNIDGNYKFNGR